MALTLSGACSARPTSERPCYSGPGPSDLERSQLSIPPYLGSPLRSMCAYVPRTLTGQFCSTSCAPPEGKWLFRCGASGTDAGRQEARKPGQSPSGWVGTGCNLQRRPHAPQISSKVREGAAVVQGLEPSLNGDSSGRNGLGSGSSGGSFVSTQFVAESLIPTASGKYRVRAYRHSVSVLVCLVNLQCGFARL